MALAGLMLGSCSSEDVVDNGKGGGASWNSDGTGYVNLAIKLPTTPASRGLNDDFNDGEASEYAVYDATLVLFTSGENETEQDAVVNSAYKLNLDFKNDPSKPVTTTANITQKINSISSEKIYALVVLNNQGMMAVDEDANLFVGNQKMEGKKISDLNDAVRDYSTTNNMTSWHSAGNGFLMSNAVLTTESGNGSQPAGQLASVQTLSVIDGAKIYPTANEATLDPAAIIYVERAEAKITLSAGAGLNNTVTVGNDDVDLEIEGWALDNTNNSNKLIHTVAGYADWSKLTSNGVSNYRFVGNTPVGKNILKTDLYRVYWGDDYNYTTTSEDDLTYFPSGKTLAENDLNASGASAYCFENTTNLATMRENNCTRVIVKAKINDGNSFFIVDGNVNKIYYEADAKQEAAARVVADNDINKWLEEHLKPETTFNSATDLEITLSALNAGKVTVTGIKFTPTGLNKLKDGSVNGAQGVAAGWVASANNHILLEYYAGGAAYYPVYVAHFGNDLTPWDEKETEAPSANNIYPGGDKNYLGRWGVLRNNWYQINVTSIKSIGSPTVEEASGSPIDKKESYISVTVNTLPWAVRRQDAEL